MAFGSRAATTSYVNATLLQVGSATLKIMPGSVADSLTVSGGSLTVSVPAGEALDLRSPYPWLVNLENDSMLPSCNVIAGSLDNQMFIQGPRVVTVTPGTVNCTTGNADSNIKPSLTITQPAAGSTLHSGDSVQLFWQSSGQQAQNVTIRMSRDGGATFPLAVAENIGNIGFFQWTVPTVTTTDHARLKFYGLDGQGNIVALAVSPGDFRVEGTEPPPSASPGYDYDAAAATEAAVTIDVNQALALPAGAPTPTCHAGLRVKIASSPSVYFCGADGKRHAFPNRKIHDSWYAGEFGGVAVISDASMASLPLGANVTYRPGVRLVKIQTDPRVYAVAADGILRWVPSEDAALALYGSGWNQMIDDVPDSFFADYKIGTLITMR